MNGGLGHTRYIVLKNALDPIEAVVQHGNRNFADRPGGFQSLFLTGGGLAGDRGSAVSVPAGIARWSVEGLLSDNCGSRWRLMV